MSITISIANSQNRKEQNCYTVLKQVNEYKRDIIMNAMDRLKDKLLLE